MIEDILINNFKLKEHQDDKLEYFDRYYTDSEENRYLFIFNTFTSFEELEQNWHDRQNQDIALYLQNEKYQGMDLRWDMYYLLFYIAKEEIKPARIYDIERDKYICRKLIIKLGSEQEINDQLDLKLPVSNGFYNLAQRGKTFSEDDFYHRLINKTKLNKLKIKKEILLNPLANKKELRTLLEEAGDIKNG